MKSDTCGYFGKYRGKVANNIDPNQLGRLQVRCPAVLGEGRLSWAMPSTPYAGPGVGLFLIPPTGANVWLEFEGGDPNYPIWSGCFWGLGEMPAKPAMEHIKLLKTDGVSIAINDMQSAGGLAIDVTSPAVRSSIRVRCDIHGVRISIGKSQIRMTTEEITSAFGEDASTRLSEEGIEMDGKESTAKFQEKIIEVVGAEHTLKFTEDGIEIAASKSSIKLTEDSAEIANDKASVSAASDTVTVTGDSSEGVIGSSGIELSDGSGSAKLSSGKFSVNDGALEVQ